MYATLKVRSCMPYKPMPPRIYLDYIKSAGWTLEKGKIDWNLYDENGNFIPRAVKPGHLWPGCKAPLGFWNGL